MYEPDEMSDGAKLAVSAGLLAVGGFVAWWIGKPATLKTAGGSSAKTAGSPLWGTGVQQVEELELQVIYLVARNKGFADCKSGHLPTHKILESTWRLAMANAAMATEYGYSDGWAECQRTSTPMHPPVQHIASGLQPTGRYPGR